MLKAIRKSKAIRLTLHLTIATLASVSLFLWKAQVQDSGIFKLIGLQPASAQFGVPQDAWRKVYERLPDLPLENQYVSNQTGKVDSNSTLVSRLIRYHMYVKSRPAFYRFDWKLTLADYLGVYDYLDESRYPGNDTLKENPMEGDRAAIQKLTRTQRDALVNVLVSIFSPNRPTAPAPAPAPTPSTSSPPPTTPNPSNSTPSLPQPGDAQLLVPDK
jgi:hypothetical protein